VNGNPSVELVPERSNKIQHTAFRISCAVERIERRGCVLALYRSEKDAFTQDDLRVILAISPSWPFP